MKRTLLAAVLVSSLMLPSAEAKDGTMHDTALRVAHATLEVINDVGQRKLAVETGDPRAWTPSTHQIEKDTKLWADELAQLGGLEPPKKSWLDADMATLKRWVDVLNEEANAQGESCSPEVQSTLADLNKSFATLQSLTAAPPYDNLKIAAAALNVRDAAKKIDQASRGVKAKK